MNEDRDRVCFFSVHPLSIHPTIHPKRIRRPKERRRSHFMSEAVSLGSEKEISLSGLDFVYFLSLSLHLWHLLHAPPPHQRGGWRVQLHPCAKDPFRALTSISQHTAGTNPQLEKLWDSLAVVHFPILPNFLIGQNLLLFARERRRSLIYGDKGGAREL